jgi:voltage-gated sodium channel
MSEIVNISKRIVDSKFFQSLVIGVILFSALLLGVETNFAFREQYSSVLHLLDRIVLGFFLFEIALKLLAQGKRFPNYFRDGWNLLDVIIVVGCLIPSSSNALAVFRLVRVLRILRLITALPKLRIIVTALLKSIPSLGSVSILLFIHFYTFAVLGVFLFGQNDPLHFGGLGRSFLSLFTILTLEGWVDIMKIQMAGCTGADFPGLAELCNSSQAQPVAAILYFLSFIILGTMIMLNLLIGVVVGSMAEAQGADDDKKQLMNSLQRMEEKLAAIEKRLS